MVTGCRVRQDADPRPGLLGALPWQIAFAKMI